MNRLPAEIVGIIMEKLDTVSYIRCLETGSSLFYKNQNQYDVKRLKYEEVKRVQEDEYLEFGLTSIGKLAEFFAPLNLAGFKDYVLTNKEDYRKCFVDLQKKYQ